MLGMLRVLWSRRSSPLQTALIWNMWPCLQGQWLLVVFVRLQLTSVIKESSMWLSVAAARKPPPFALHLQARNTFDVLATVCWSVVQALKELLVRGQTVSTSRNTEWKWNLGRLHRSSNEDFYYLEFFIGKRIINLAPSPALPAVPLGMARVNCAHCADSFLFNTLNNSLARCPHCRKL